MLQPHLELFQKYPYSFLTDFCLVISVVSGMLNWRFLDTANRALSGMLILIFGIELVLIHFAAYGQNNHFLFNMISLVTVIGMGVAFTRGPVKAPEKQTIGLLVLIYSVVYAHGFQWTRVVEHLLAVERLLLLGFVGIYFRRLVAQMFVPNMLQHAMFWTCVGIIIHCSASLYILLAIRFPFFNGELFARSYQFYWMFAQWGTAFLYLVTGAAFWVRRVEVMKPAV